jgi:ClpX C4-type zinc finger protein
MITNKRQAAVETLRCSFCNKNQADVNKLIAGPAVFICDECVEVCNDIILDDRRLAEICRDTSVEQPKALLEIPVSGPVVQCTLCGLPITRSEGVVIHNRGILCLGCVGEVEAAAAERREPR